MFRIRIYYSKIKGIDIPFNDIDDSFCWGLSSLGEFTTKSATWLAYNLRQSNWDRKWIWKIDTMPKIQFFLWQMFHHALPVTGILIRRDVNLNPSCPLCLEDIETIYHLFKDCCITKRVWEFAVKHGWIDTVSIPDRGLDLLVHLHRLEHTILSIM